MEFIETDSLTPDRSKLLLLLRSLQEQAQDDNHFKIASITLQTRVPDPLGVLAAIYETDDLHYYVEHPQLGLALAAAESAVSARFEGSGRFACAQAFAEDVFAHTVALGDYEHFLGGPRFFVAFSFFDEREAGCPFAPATLFLPVWQVGIRNGIGFAVANVRVDPESDVDALADRLLAAHQRFARDPFDLPTAPKPSREPSSFTPLADTRPAYTEAVRGALRHIADGQVQKLVLARNLTFANQELGSPSPIAILQRLRQRFPQCYAFSFSDASGRSFIGATPERLFTMKEECVCTDAIAGSAARHPDPATDAALGRALLNSAKDKREHQFVIQSVRKALARCGLTLLPSRETRLLELPNVRHLKTPLESAFPKGKERPHPLALAASLHPTPAVGGSPREAALDLIRQLEPFPRGLFAGFTGWFDWRGLAEFTVAIRCAELSEKNLTLYAGAGIVEGSDPETETQETSLKLNALLNALSDSEAPGIRNLFVC